MGGAGVWWSDVRRMLDDCAAGWSEELKLHHRWIRYAGRTWRAFPKGTGTGGRDYEVKAWEVRKMLRGLMIDAACASRHLPAL